MKDAILLPQNRFTWSLLAFQGGFINVGGLLTVHIFVSHITGFSAHFSLALTSVKYADALYFLLVPGFFLFGAAFCSIFTELRRKNNLPPIYIHMLLLLSLLYTGVALLGHHRVFGEFGEPFTNFRDFVLLCILAFSCGAQNALFTHYSGSIVRTTHLTGITTDLGIGLAKVFIGGDRQESRLNRMRIEIILSFILGSMIGAITYPQLGFLGFIIPALISVFVGWILYRSRIKMF